jgi:hypothetical protein
VPSWELSADSLRLLAEAGLSHSSNLMDDIVPYVHPDTALVELPVQWILDDAAHWWFSSSDWNRKIASPSEVREIWEQEFLGIHANGGCCVFTMHTELMGATGSDPVVGLLHRISQEPPRRRDRHLHGDRERGPRCQNGAGTERARDIQSGLTHPRSAVAHWWARSAPRPQLLRAHPHRRRRCCAAASQGMLIEHKQGEWARGPG